MPPLRQYTKSKFALHPQYPRILALYNDEFQKNNGNVNNLKFYRDVIKPVFPEFGMQSWYQFLARHRTVTGLIVAQALNTLPAISKGEAEEQFSKNLLTSEMATQIGINTALNVGAIAFKEIIDDPDVLKKIPPEKRAEFLFKAMKAQDSRIHALGKVREDSREQAKFERAFEGAAFE